MARLTDLQVWSLEELAENGPGTGSELRARGHSVSTLTSFVGRDYIESMGDGTRRLALTDEGRESLDAVPRGRRGRERPLSWRQRKKGR